MKIPNYDLISESDSDYKRLLPYMPSNTFRMLMCGPSGCGKTNTLLCICSIIFSTMIRFTCFPKI